MLYSVYISATATHPNLLRAPIRAPIFLQQEDECSSFTFFNAEGLRPSLRFVNSHGGSRIATVSF